MSKWLVHVVRFYGDLFFYIINFVLLQHKYPVQNIVQIRSNRMDRNNYYHKGNKSLYTSVEKLFVNTPRVTQWKHNPRTIYHNFTYDRNNENLILPLYLRFITLKFTLIPLFISFLDRFSLRVMSNPPSHKRYPFVSLWLSTSFPSLIGTGP